LTREGGSPPKTKKKKKGWKSLSIREEGEEKKEGKIDVNSLGDAGAEKRNWQFAARSFPEPSQMVRNRRERGKEKEGRLWLEKKAAFLREKKEKWGKQYMLDQV